MIVSASEFQKNFGHFKEVAQREPVTVTSNGRESVVLVSAIEFEVLTKLREQFARNNGVDEDFKKLVAERAEVHKDVLDDLSQR